MTNLGLTAHQLANAKGIIAAVQARKWSQKAAVIAVETALTESGMRVLASANVPSSMKYPHDLLSWTWDGLGHDHASCGMYQQQVGPSYALWGTSTVSDTTWGTPAQLMSAEKSTEIFLSRLANHPWATMPNWQAAQAVQRSAFADGSNYRANDARARAIVEALWDTKPAPAPAHKPVPAPAHKTYRVRSGDTLSSIAKRYHTYWQTLAKINKLKNPNLIYVGQLLRIT